MQTDAAARAVTSTESNVVVGVQAETQGNRSIWAAVQTPPEKGRQIIELAYYGGWEQGEIADMSELPLDTARSRARAGLLKPRNAPLSELEAPP